MLKPQVHEALARFAGVLKLRHAHVAYLYLPHGEAGAKIGVDDYLAAGHSTDELLALASTELRKPADVKDNEPPSESFDDVPAEPGHRVLDDIARFLDRFIVWPSAAERDAIVLWVAHTHVITTLDFTPRLALLSPVKQCAKTRVLELVVRLVRRARHSVSMSAAFMFRVIEDQAPTLLVDEVDTIFGKRSKDETGEALRGLIDAGFERGATVGRIVGEGAGMQPKDFPVFCPVGLAGIGDCLPDTIVDRSIVVRMRRRAPGETVEAFRRRRVGAQAEALRRRLGSWAETAGFTIEATIDADPALPDGVEDRAADCWEPIIAWRTPPVAHGPNGPGMPAKR